LVASGPDLRMVNLLGACAVSGAPWPVGADWVGATAGAEGAGGAPRPALVSCVGGRGALAAAQVASDAGLTVAIRGAPRWREVALDTPPEEDAKRVITAYRRYGRDFLGRLGGSFAVAIHDANVDTLLLAIDRMGIERMAYAASADGLYFGTSAATLAAAPGIGKELSLQSIYDYLFFHMVPSPSTLYRRVAKLPCANYLEYRSGRITTGYYWKPTFVPAGAPRDPRLEEQLLDALRVGVVDSAPNERSGAFLSGGLDSSTVAGMLARVSGRARTFSIGFGTEGFDELEYARIAAAWFKLDSTEYVARATDIIEQFPAIARAYDEPFGNSSALPTLCCARLAREHGVDHLLAGDGGDELFAGNKRYADQQVFERYATVPRILRRGLLDPLLGALPGPLRRVDVLRRAANYVEQANTPLPRRLETWNLLHKLGVANLLDPEFLGAIDTGAPLALMDSVYQACPPAHNIDNMLFYDWRFTLGDNDLRKVETMCGLAGVRVSYPMLDNAVIDVAARVPPDWKLEQGRLRHFYKQAAREFLPPEILDKRKHGFGLPFGLWLRESAPMRSLFFDALSRLRARRIIRAEALDNMRKLNDADDASYYGVLIWVFAMLEVWFEEHSVAP
jgi:asparagine synthase (glutamine-hydrolysing)